MTTIVPTFYGKVERGKLTLSKPEVFARYLKTLTGAVYLTVQKPKKIRTEMQNNYYWGVVIALLSDYSGHDAQEVHEAMRLRFAPPYKIFGVIKPMSTARMGKAEFSEYVEKIKAWAGTDLKLHIPEPNEVE